jgi:hypothetical protein
MNMFEYCAKLHTTVAPFDTSCEVPGKAQHLEWQNPLGMRYRNIS